jgi:type IV pilus assembly protein PilA
MPRDDEGFTLIELLVVIVVVGILAAVAVPVYLRQREKAWRVQAVNDMKNAATALEAYATDTEGSYAGANGATEVSTLLRDNGFRNNVLVGVEVVTTATEYCITGRHMHLPNVVYVYRSGVGVVQIGKPGVLNC